MAGKPKYDWDSLTDDMIREAYTATRSYTLAGQALGLERGGALREHLRDVRPKLKAELDAMTGAKLTAVPPPEAVPVDDPLRIKTVQQDALISQLRSEIKQYDKALATQEEFFARVVEQSRVPVTVPKFKTVKAKRDGLPRLTAVIPIYDCQYGQHVKMADVVGLRGEFSSQIFDHRLKRWTETVIRLLRDKAASNTFDELIIPLGGDQVEGDEIYAGMPWQLEMDPIRQMLEIAEKLAVAIEAIIRVAKEELGIPWVSAYAVPGNHGKVGGKRGGARPATYSWDYGAFEILKDKLRAQPIDEFVIRADGALFFYAAGHEFQMIHGDEIRGWGGIPYYGIARFDAKSVRLHNRLYRYLIMGHIHQPAEITTGSGAETLVSGDWVGPNNLTRHIVAGSRPQQRIIWVNEDHGVVGTDRVFLTDGVDAFEPTEIHGRRVA